MNNLYSSLETIAKDLKINIEQLIDIFVKVSQKEISDYYEIECDVSLEDSDLNIKFIDPLGMATVPLPKCSKNLPLSLLRSIRAKFKGELGILKSYNTEQTAISSIGELVKGKIVRINDKSVTVNVFNCYTNVSLRNFAEHEEIEKYKEFLFIVSDAYKDNTKLMIFLSRNNSAYFKKIVEEYIPEIKNGLISIVGVFYSFYQRLVIVVQSDSIKKPSLQCIGFKGERLKSIAGELGFEKIIFVDNEGSIQSKVRSMLGIFQDEAMIVDGENEVSVLVLEASIARKKFFLKVSEIMYDVIGKKVSVYNACPDSVISVNAIIEILFGELSYQVSSVMATTIQSIEELFNIKGSYLKVNLLLSENEIEGVFSILLASMFDFNGKFLQSETTLIIREDITIEEYKNAYPEKIKNKK